MAPARDRRRAAGMRLVGSGVVTPRYRCRSCGNLTRFDVESTRRTRAFWHYTVGGELTVEDEEPLDESIEAVACRWCGASGDAIERVGAEAVAEGGAP